MKSGRISSLVLGLGLLAAMPLAAENLYRWVDENGKVHFTTTLPADHADKPYDIYSSKGILLQSVTDPVALQRARAEAARNAGAKPKKIEPLYSEEEKRLIADRLLVLKYQSEAEIVDAMNLEIDHLKYDQNILTATHNSLMNSLAAQVRVAADRQRSGMAVEDKQRQEMDTLRRRLRENTLAQQEIEGRRQAIHATYDAELERYRLLMQQQVPATPES